MKTEPEDIDELDLFLREKQMAGLWHVKEEERPLHPKTRVRPYLWKWPDVHHGLLQARDRIGVKSGSVERRVIYLVNPGMSDTSHTIHVAFQLIQPGEVAPAHRHTMAAIRFILQGKGGHVRCPPLELARARQPILKRRCHPVLDERCACPQTLRPLP